jgi:hypothetical protein
VSDAPVVSEFAGRLHQQVEHRVGGRIYSVSYF